MKVKATKKNLPAPIETLEHRKALMYYYALGKDRTMEDVAKAFHVKLQTVAAWSRSFKWREQVQAMDKKTAERLKYEDPERIVQFHKDILLICDAWIAEQKRRIEYDEEGKPLGVLKDEHLAAPAIFDKFFELRHRALREEPYPENIPQKKDGDGNTTAIQINITKD